MNVSNFIKTSLAPLRYYGTHGLNIGSGTPGVDRRRHLIYLHDFNVCNQLVLVVTFIHLTGRFRRPRWTFLRLLRSLHQVYLKT